MIYGNGFIGKRFIKQIERMNCHNHISAIAVTNPDEYGSSEKEILLSVYEIAKDSLVFIAAHESIATEMKKVLDDIGVRDYIWIYPCLLDLELGKPVELNRKVKIDDLMANLSKSYAAAIYYLSIKEYCRNHTYDGSLYIKMTSHYTTEDTAKKDGIFFVEKLKNVREQGLSKIAI